MTPPPRLAVAGLAKSFHGVAVLRDIDLTVAGSEFVAILGPSGAGKTTLFRCLTGLLTPDSGVVRVDGVTPRTILGDHRVAVVFQRYDLVARLSALDNVLAGRLGTVPAWRGLSHRFSRADRIFALECLERVGLLPQAQVRASALSGGQQQRVSIARALAQRPQIIVADEPVASLDPASAAVILDLMRTLTRREGVAVLCSLHQADLARTYCDRVVGLAEGRIVLECAAPAFGATAAQRLYAGATDP